MSRPLSWPVSSTQVKGDLGRHLSKSCLNRCPEWISFCLSLLFKKKECDKREAAHCYAKKPQIRVQVCFGRLQNPPVVDTHRLPADVDRQSRLSIDVVDLDRRSSDELAWLIRECITHDMRAEREDNATVLIDTASPIPHDNAGFALSTRIYREK